MTEHVTSACAAVEPQACSADALAGTRAGVDASIPNVARIYDYLLGGKENYASDRQAAQELTRLLPEAAAAARHNRDFLQRVVRFLATDAGVRQYIDIGAGLPTGGNVHEIAQRWRPGSHVLYVDNDAAVVSHAQALLADNSTAVAINRDFRTPRAIIDHPATQALINFDEPIAVLLVAVLHFVSDDDNPRELVRQIIDVLPQGSYLVISHGTADAMVPSAVRNVRRLYDRADTASAPRSRDNIARFFDGCQLIEPGLVSAEVWRNGYAAAESDRIIFYAGVGVKQ
jgi:SAM-dependent methyltransferase